MYSGFKYSSQYMHWISESMINHCKSFKTLQEGCVNCESLAPFCWLLYAVIALKSKATELIKQSDPDTSMNKYPTAQTNRRA